MKEEVLVIGMHFVFEICNMLMPSPAKPVSQPGVLRRGLVFITINLYILSYTFAEDVKNNAEK
ncbi:MAG TPA: hypothetical protein VKR42_09210 [Ktedonobacteraceae bacterium]|nr:hypothetical protein [Ktedonobacteraceae bacterium]